MVMLSKGKSQWILRKKWSGGVTHFSINSETIRLFNVSIFFQIRNTTAWVSETMLQADHRDKSRWKAGATESGSCRDLQKYEVFALKHFKQSLLPVHVQAATTIMLAFKLLSVQHCAYHTYCKHCCKLLYLLWCFELMLSPPHHVKQPFLIKK